MNNLHDIEKILAKGLKLHHYANTAYPLTPSSFAEYRVKGDDNIKQLISDDWKPVDETALYVHIPYCEHRCRYCEYAVVSGKEQDFENEYSKLLLNEIQMFKQVAEGKTIVGYDIGGGTPTYISKNNLERITHKMYETFKFNQSVGMSIETTPIIAVEQYDKIKFAYELGYKRISMGIQTINPKLLQSFERKGSVKMYTKAAENIRNAGYTRFNIDLMYGFLNQKIEDFEATVQFAISLKPEYITLYRNRYKGTKIEHEASKVSLQKVNAQYERAYNILLENGYYANSGKNTFSAVPDDYGTSEYLTKRVIEGIAYLGLGLGAQSFAHSYLSYNAGAANKKLIQYRKKILSNIYPIQDIYKLPKEEQQAKMISVAFYFGFIDTEAFNKRFNADFNALYEKEIQYLTEHNYMHFQGNRFTLRPKAKDFINGIIPLFYSRKSKQELLNF